MGKHGGVTARRVAKEFTLARIAGSGPSRATFKATDAGWVATLQILGMTLPGDVRGRLFRTEMRELLRKNKQEQAYAVGPPVEHASRSCGKAPA